MPFQPEHQPHIAGLQWLSEKGTATGKKWVKGKKRCILEYVEGEKSRRIFRILQL
jgi:hypothetical protein